MAAFDPELSGVISAGGVGFDISCGVRLLTTDLIKSDIDPLKEQLADILFTEIYRGVAEKAPAPYKDVSAFSSSNKSASLLNSLAISAL